MDFFKKHQGLSVLLFSSTFIFLFSSFFRDGFLASFDKQIFSSLYLYPTQATTFFLVISNSFSPEMFILFSIALALILLFRKQKKWAIFFLVTMGFGMLSMLLLKDIFALSRPEIMFIPETGWSFPSGHATAVAIFFFSILYALKKTISNYRIAFAWTLISLLFLFVIGLSRIHLGVHWFTDVVAGFALGVFWVALWGLIYEKIHESQANHS